jgi:pseudouridine synthase
MRDGVDLGDATLARAEAAIIGHRRNGAVLRIVLREGRKREIKRLCEAIGHPVLSLKRISYAGIRARRIGRGKWRRLSPTEIQRLMDLLGETAEGQSSCR